MNSYLAGLISFIVALIGAADGAVAQGYPNKSIEFVLTYGPGSNSDILARFLGQRLTESLGQQVVIVNRGGGNTVIGTQSAAKAAPDGYTLFVGQTSNMAIVPALYNRGGPNKLPYDTAKDFEPVAFVGVTTSVLVVHYVLPAKSVKELIALAKANPGKLNYASSGSGGTTHLVMELFKRMAGIDMVHIPFVGTAPQMTAIMSGEVDLGITSMLAVGPHVKAGRLRALAVSGIKRSPAAPDIPTLAEAGVPGFEAESWFGVLAPTGIPRETVTRLNTEINRILRENTKLLSDRGIDVEGRTPEQFGALLKKEFTKWTKVVIDSGAKVD